MDDLVAFLRDRLAEDEAAARKVPEDLREIPLGLWAGTGPMEHLARHSAARVLREVEAKRRIVDEYAERAHYDNEDWHYEGATGRIHGLGEALRFLASVYSDHPSFREEWRP